MAQQHILSNQNACNRHRSSNNLIMSIPLSKIDLCRYHANEVAYFDYKLPYWMKWTCVNFVAYVDSYINGSIRTLRHTICSYVHRYGYPSTLSDSMGHRAFLNSIPPKLRLFYISYKKYRSIRSIHVGSTAKFSFIILPAQPQDLILLQFLLLLLSSTSFLLLLLSVNIAISPTAYMVWPCDSGIFISLMTATKLMGLEIHLRSFGVTGVKKVNHVKNMKTALI